VRRRAGCCGEDPSVGVFAVAGGQRLTLYDLERASPVRLALGAQEEGGVELVGVGAVGEFVHVRDEEDSDLLVDHRADDLARDLGAFALVGRGERLVTEQDGLRRDLVGDLAHPAQLLIELAALHGRVLFAPVVREDAGILRAAAWTARGLRVPARNALLADTVTPSADGRAYGFERAMDNLGAIGGTARTGARSPGRRARRDPAVDHPGLLAAGAIVYAIHHVPRLERHQRQPIRLRLRPVMRGRLGRLMVAVGAFEFGNIAATLLILCATELFEPGRSTAAATQLALVLYTAYNLAASAIAGALWTVISPAAAFIYAAAWMALAVAGLLMTDHGDLRANGEIRRLAPPRASESASLSGLRTACLVRGARRCGSCWRALRDATRVVGGGRGRAARFEITRQSGGRWLAAGHNPLSKR
jgi:hypothetical protein